MELFELILYLALFAETALAATVKRNNETDSNVLDDTFEEMISPDYWWESSKDPQADVKKTRVRAIEEDILNSLSRLDPKQKHRIFDDLKKQKSSQKAKSLTLAESDGPSPLSVVELKAVQKSIKTSDGVLPPIRNKRTLNFLLFAVARAMGYMLVPRNPNAEMLPMRSNPCKGTAPRPPPCAPPPPTTPPPPPPPPPCGNPHHPCPTPPPPPPPPPTIPPNQIDANTVRYPYRPSQQIPLLQFAPLPPGVTVPYPPLLQWPCDPPQPTPKPNPCAPPTKAPPPCAPPSPPPPPCAPRPPPPPPPPCATNPHHPCPPPSSSANTTTAAAAATLCKKPSSPLPSSSTSTNATTATVPNSSSVRSSATSTAETTTTPASTLGGSSQSAIPEKLEEYEKLDEESHMRDQNDQGNFQANIFRENEETEPSEELNYEDGEDEVREELYNRESEDEEAEEPERYYERRMAPEPNRNRKINANLIEDVSKQQGYYKSSFWDRPPKKAVLKRVIKIRKPVTQRIDENGNEYTFASSTVHEIRKRDLQDFDFIRKYKETHGDLDDDQHKEESPRGRTTTSIRKIEVKKFVVNKSEDDPEEYHEKNERNLEDPPQKAEKQPEPEKQRESEEEGGDEEEKTNYRHYEPPEYEERREMDKALEKELEKNEEEEPVPPKTAVYDSPPPSGKGIQYVTKTITKYVGGTGGGETIKYVPIYKVIHAPPPPPPPPQVRKIIHHHHHRIPVYPKIVVRTGTAAKRRPSFLAHFGNAGNLLLVTIRERNG
ncbi:UNVERIFIED_CONTAM: hypothetical protein PYX00_009259 [Menopon gallinae]|uniref:Uncharacterized protein n=1 Tax=Menopon gallinae TaxID=328185 RepID=A0AAW2HAW9_9NEOP